MESIIIALDWDAFYCSVEEHFNPSLRNVPFGVKQKSIICTSNYVARSLGVQKLSRITDALKICPDMILVNGEDLSRYRDVSKYLWKLVRDIVWEGRVERLGFDELFLDVTAMVDYNINLFADEGILDDLERRDPNSFVFFRLNKIDQKQGFYCQLSQIAGHYAVDNALLDPVSPEYIRLLLGSHLCKHIRDVIYKTTGYTSSGGVSVNKALAKMAGAQYKPNQQCSLLFKDAQSFLDPLDIRKIPGIGSKINEILLQKIYGTDVNATKNDSSIHAIRFLCNNNVLIGLFGERTGERIWSLLHGIDTTKLRPAIDVPTQISIEDTYKSLESRHDVQKEIRKLTHSLMKRVYLDLKDETGNWIGIPHQVRFILNQRTRSRGLRESKTGPAPSIIFSDSKTLSEIVDVLLTQTFMPMFNRLLGSQREFDIALLNVAVVGIQPVDIRNSSMMQFFTKKNTHSTSTNIAGHFAITEESARDNYDVSSESSANHCGTNDGYDNDDDDGKENDEVDFLTTNAEKCQFCQRCIFPFALEAHLRYHEYS
ncbi:hypothetical protein V1511DRAFT_502603 [Dipodascopsis uninucleata]